MSPTSTLPVPHQDSQSVWARHYATAAGFRWWPCEELVRAVAGRRFDTIVEAGCGNGANLWFLAEHARLVIGVDHEQEALKAASAYLSTRKVTNVALRQGDVKELPCDLASADLLVDVMTSQHMDLTDHAALYRGYRRSLKQGGRVFLYHLALGTTTTGATQRGVFTWSGLPLFPQVGTVCLPPAWALCESLMEAGFSVEPPRQVTRHYSNGEMAVYAVIEGEAV